MTAPDISTPEGRAEVRKLCEAATVGPFKRFPDRALSASGSCDTCPGSVWATVVRFEETEQTDSDGRNFTTSGSAHGNRDFFAAAVTALPAALDRIEKLEAALRIFRDAGFPPDWPGSVIPAFDACRWVQDRAREALQP